MINFLAGLVAQLALCVLFEHKSDAIIFGCLLIVLLLLRQFGLIALNSCKGASAVATKQTYTRRESL